MGSALFRNTGILHKRLISFGNGQPSFRRSPDTRVGDYGMKENGIRKKVVFLTGETCCQAPRHRVYCLDIFVADAFFRICVSVKERVMKNRVGWICFIGALLSGWLFLGCAETVQETQTRSIVQSKKTLITEGGLKVKEFDLNQDMEPDVFKYYKPIKNAENGTTEYVLVKRELDLNNDGKIDVLTEYDDERQIVMETFDLDFDGRIDLTDHYANGQLIKKDVDFAFDEKPDMFKYFLKGQLVRKEKDRNNDGRIDYWEYWEKGRLDRIGVDVDGDGEVDTWKTAEEAMKEAGIQAPPEEAPPAEEETELEEGAEEAPAEEGAEKAPAEEAPAEEAPAEEGGEAAE